jgi:purine catabolism regulator
MTTSAVKLNDLVRLAFEQPAQWLAGKHKAQTPVNWVSASAEELNPGDLLILSEAEISSATYSDVISHAIQQGAAALLLIGQTPGLLGDPGEWDLPILAVPEIQDLRTAQRTLLTILISQRAALSERGARINAQLSQIAADGGGLKGLARVMVEISGRGTLVQDKRGRVLAESPSPVLQAIWSDVLAQLESLERIPPSLRDRKLAGHQARSIVQEIPGGLERLMRPIIVSDVARGYISLVASTGELDALDQVVIEQGCLVSAFEMARDKAVREAEKRLKGDLLTALLQENLVPRDARLWAQSMGMDLDQAHVALRFTWDVPEAPSRRRLETLVNGEVSRLSLRVIVNPMGSEVTCICQVPARSDRPTVALQLGQSVLDQGRVEYPNIPARCGVGTPAEDLTTWRDSFRQAGQALEMARRMGETKPLYFPDLSVYRLLMQIEHNPELINFYEETLGPLLAYEGGNDLIQTLEAYFEHKGNLSQAAEALYIHRNTLLYRMDRIQEILIIDLDRPTSRLAVQLALYIYRMMGSKPSSRI